MVRGHTKAQKCLSMLQSAVASIPFPAIARIVGRKVTHNPIARYLCDNGRCCNRHRTIITLDQTISWKIQTGWDKLAVDQGKIGTPWQSFDRAAHCQECCLQNVKLINLANLGNPYPNLGAIHDRFE